MLSRSIYRFNTLLSSMDEQQYLLARIAYEAAPTLAGLKPSSLVTFCRHARDSDRIWEEHKQAVEAVLGLSYCELQKTDRHALVLFFQGDSLAALLDRPESRAYIASLGYEDDLSLPAVFTTLQARMAGDFPHELGLLLGIPLADIVAFTVSRGAGCLFCGYWKVYSEPAKARALFTAFDRAKDRMLESICRLGRWEAATA